MSKVCILCVDNHLHTHTQTLSLDIRGRDRDSDRLALGWEHRCKYNKNNVKNAYTNHIGRPLNFRGFSINFQYRSNPNIFFLFRRPFFVWTKSRSIFDCELAIQLNDDQFNAGESK